jgi:serine/threonine protein kinase
MFLSLLLWKPTFSLILKVRTAMKSEHVCMGCMKEKGSVERCPYCDWLEGTAPESTLHLPPRTLLQDKYLIGRVLGQGGFGITYLAWDSLLDRKLAVKEFFPRELATRNSADNTVRVHSSSYDEQFSYGLDKFLDEAKTLAKFDNHPNVIAVKDFFRANGTAYLVMNYLEGCTLKDYLLYKGVALTFDEALAVTLPVLDALQTVHEAGVLHRDISPDNIFITAQGSIIVLDFGAARHALGEKGKNLSIILKPGYAPEEQYRSRGVQGPWTDIYAVAATFYHAVTGTMPQESLDRLAVDQLVSPSLMGVAISPTAEQALLKALAVNAENRYKTVGEFRDAIMAGGESTAPVAETLIEAAQANKAAELNQLAQPFPAEPRAAGQPSAVINIGRHDSNDLVLSDQGASRFHAAVYEQNGNWYLLDRDSTHGTFINGQRVEGAALLPVNARIRISDTNLTFEGNALITDSGIKVYATYGDVVAYRESAGFELTNSSTQGEQNVSIAKMKTPFTYLGVAVAAVAITGFLLLNMLNTNNSQRNGNSENDSLSQPAEEQAEILDFGTIEFDGGVYTGELKDGKPHGQGTWVYKKESQNLSFSATGSSVSRFTKGSGGMGKKHGTGRMTMPTGLIQTGIWENDNYLGSSSQ